MNINKFALIIITILACSWSIPTAHAEFLVDLTVKTAVRPDGLTDYTYTLSNLPTSTLNAYVFNLVVSDSSAIQSLTGPSGWEVIYTPGDTLAIWASSDTSTDVLPGQSVTFAFASTLNPISQDYAIQGADTAGTNFDQSTGLILSPGAVSVPEPTSMIPMGVGMATLAGYSTYRRSKPTRPPSH